jgi:hypothetical protein
LWPEASGASGEPNANFPYVGWYGFGYCTCPVVVAGLVSLLGPAVGVELADPQHLVEEAGNLDSQRSEEEAGLVGSAMVAENWIRPTPRCPLEWVPC